MINTSLLFAMELIGTIAFACSGALVGIRKKLDLLGVIVLAVIIATGGGMFRDILIGNVPPALFRNPFYAGVAVLAAILIFFTIQSKRLLKTFMQIERYNQVFNSLDAIGLGAFTVVGVDTAISYNVDSYFFLTLFVGVITGVGGGLIRDIMVCEIPSILKEHIYACASLAGALLYAGTWQIFDPDIAMITSALIVIAIRMLARHYDWNLPHSKLS
ncbi:MAG: trimeric intracellular cation channel family protein [Dorea sp.]|nr:trimeric intracellular cation channel family protein [Dorea sp.]